MNSWLVAWPPEATDHSKSQNETQKRELHCPTDLEGDGHELKMVHCSPGNRAKSQQLAAESLNRSWEFEEILYFDFKKMNVAWNRKHAEPPASE